MAEELKSGSSFRLHSRTCVEIIVALNTKLSYKKITFEFISDMKRRRVAAEGNYLNGLMSK